MAEEIVGSRFKDFPSADSEYTTDQVPKSTRGYGQNADPTPSSLSPSQARKVSKNASSLTNGPVTLPSDYQARQINAPGWETRPVKSEPFKPSFGMKGASRASTIPAGNNRAVSQIAPRGSAKR
jgi:hypothetical protein